MTARMFGEMLGATFGLGVYALMAASVILIFFWPLMAWNAMRNIRQIRIQLERLNDTLENKVSITKTGPLGLH